MLPLFAATAEEVMACLKALYPLQAEENPATGSKGQWSIYMRDGAAKALLPGAKLKTGDRLLLSTS